MNVHLVANNGHGDWGPEIDVGGWDQSAQDLYVAMPAGFLLGSGRDGPDNIDPVTASQLDALGYARHYAAPPTPELLLRLRWEPVGDRFISVLAERWASPRSREVFVWTPYGATREAKDMVRWLQQRASVVKVILVQRGGVRIGGAPNDR